LAKVIYPIEIRPYFTSSYYTASISQSITRVDDGAGARGVILQADSTTVTYNGDGNIVEPSGDITLTATSFNTTGSNYFFFYKDNSYIDTVYQNSTIVTKTIPSSEFPAGGVTQTYRVELHDGNNNIAVAPNAASSITVIGVQDGVPGYQAIVTNQNASATVDVYENLTFDNTSTEIEAYKGQTKLTAVPGTFSFPTFDELGNIIPNGEYRVSIHSYPSDYIDISGSLVSGSILPVNEDGNAYLGPLDNWTNFRNPDLTPNSSSANIVFRVDFEDGRDSALVRQNLSVQYEGNVGPGLIMRGEWTGELDYIFDIQAKRRDAVFREISGDVHYWATTIDLADAGSPPFTYQPIYTGAEQPGDIDVNGWQYLGVQDFFVAAKLAIFEESFVKNTINVGNNPGNEFANIVLAGGRVDPYIAIAQNGTVGANADQTSTGVIGYDRAGIFMGVVSSSLEGKVPKFSLRNSAGTKYLRWTGENLEIQATNLSLNAAGDLSLTGTVNANNGAFSNDITVNGRLNASNMKFGIDVSGSNDGLFINNNNYWYTDGSFSVGGAGGTMVFSADNGSININDTFIVNQDGSLNATAGTFSGNIISSNADIGGWTVGEKQIASKGGNIIFTGAVGEESIVVKDTDGVAKLSVDTITSLPSLTGGSTFGPNSGTNASSLFYQNLNYQTYSSQLQTEDLYNAVATFNCGADGDYDVNFTTSPVASSVLSAAAGWNGSYATITLFAQIYNNTDSQVIFQSQVGTLTVIDDYPYGGTSGTAITGTISRSGRVAMVSGKQYIFRYYTRISLVSYGTFGSVGYTYSEAQRLSLDYTVSAIVSRVGTFINGGGFQTLKDGNTYLRFNGGLTNTLYDVGAVNGFNTMAVRTDIGGGLGVDEIWTPGNSIPATSITTGNTSGYARLTNGMVIQFGRYSAGGAGATPTITFPLTFTKVYSASVHTNRGSAGSSGYNHIDTLSTSNMKVVVDSSDGANWWMAIGYVE
jgi:hypothetical protein